MTLDSALLRSGKRRSSPAGFSHNGRFFVFFFSLSVVVARNSGACYRQNEKRAFTDLERKKKKRRVLWSLKRLFFLCVCMCVCGCVKSMLCCCRCLRKSCMSLKHHEQHILLSVKADNLSFPLPLFSLFFCSCLFDFLFCPLSHLCLVSSSHCVPNRPKNSPFRS